MKPERTCIYLFLLIAFGGLSACYPVEKNIAYEDLDIALTQYDKDYYFPGEYNYYQNFQTFIVPDTLIHIIEEGATDEISRDYDKFILDQVRSNLLKLGYLESTDPEANPPDITVGVSVTTSEHIVYNWYPYWGWFFVFIKKGAVPYSTEVGNNYPWQPYYGYGTTYSFTSGTIILEMVDNSKVNEATQEIPVIWAGVINGATGGPSAGIKDRLSTGIDRCFNQSPYLFR